MTNYKNTNNEELSILILKIVFTGILVLYLYIMIYFSLIPGEELTDTLIPKYSMILHFLEFFGLSILSLLCFGIYEPKHIKTYMVLLIIFMAILTEGIQHFVPGRFFSLIDLIVNLFGGLLLSFIIHITIIRSTKK